MIIFFVCIVLLGIFITGAALLFILADKSRSHDFIQDLSSKKQELIDVIDDAETLVNELNQFSDYVVNQCENKQNELRDVIEKADLLSIRLSESCHILEANSMQSHRTNIINHFIAPIDDQPVSAVDGREAYFSISAKQEFIIDNRAGEDRIPEKTADVNIISNNIADESRISDNKVSDYISGAKVTDESILSYERKDADMKNAEQLISLKTIVADGKEQKIIVPKNDPIADAGRGNVIHLSDKRLRMATSADKRSQVLLLQNKGLTQSEIAKALNIGKGEIELISRVDTGK